MLLLRVLLAVLMLFPGSQAFAQVYIHSHNDYTHPKPFWDAYQQKANSIEADVFPVNGKLMVAHSKMAIRSTQTLEAMYINPIVSLFRQHGNKTVSNDTAYTFYLMIDIKEKWATVLPLLIKQLDKYPDCFNREVNPKAVQVFISGSRPPENTFHTYPPEIMFDGLPEKTYQADDLKKIVMISTDFHLYSSWNGKGSLSTADAQKLQQVISTARKENKPVRFWGAPDTPDCWKTLIDLGANVINTDKVKACRIFLASYDH